MNVLSLFNGMSFGKMALESLDIKVDNYYSSEIDKYAIQAAQALYPDTIQIGDVTKWREWDLDWSSINLVTGGFPCQAWSMAGKQLGDKDERGMLFWTMLDIMKHVRYHNPKADFLIENVKMKKEFEEYITTHTENALGHVHKILINSALVSAQNRNRYYWTSFEVDQPKDKCIEPIEILDTNGVPATSKRHGGVRVVNMKARFNCVTATYYKGVRADSRPGVLLNWSLCGSNFDDLSNSEYRKLTPRECFRLQTVPEHHIETLLNSGISNTQLYKMCGNGWTMEVIKHIFKGL
tara:strand:+ start:4440 stop:5321 length:882 start_codon:yes stop_codon:yes gene_type:complete